MSKIHSLVPSSAKFSLGMFGVLCGSIVTAQPASAAFVSLQNPVIGGTSVASPPFFTVPPATNNAILNCSIPGGTVVPCATVGGSTLGNVLQGAPGSPGGHVELNPISSPSYDFTKFTSLSGTLAGNAFSVRSLVANDWFSNSNALTKKFLTDALQVNGFDPKFLEPTNFNPLVSTFIARGGPQRFSDPNITYVLADDVTENLTLGLAGTLNASNLLKDFFAGVVDPTDIPDIVQVSEIAAIDYNGLSGYYYALGGSSFPVSTSGQSSNDTVFNPISDCVGGAASGPLDYPEAGCSYSADFQLTQIVGATPQDPIFPDTITPGGSYTYTGVPVSEGVTYWVDPPATIGYEFVAEAGGPFFASVQFLPRLGTGAENDELTILLDDGGSCNNFVSNAGTVIGSSIFTFAPSVQCFAVTGINPSLGISKGGSTPFPIALTFDGDGNVTFTQTPQVVPEPLTLLGASVAVGFGGLFKRRRSAKNSHKE
jgi:hypothetical protein